MIDYTDDTPRALVISDFPILARSAVCALQDRYEVAVRSWSAAENATIEAELVIVDVTEESAETAQALLRRATPGALAALCSLHRNEIELYRIEPHGPTAEGQLPSLLSLP